MDLPKVLIADPEDAFREALAAALAPHFQVNCAVTGPEALGLVRTWMPDVLILELILPNMDGISLLRQLSEDARRPAVLVVSSLLNSKFVQSALSQLEVSYAMLKTCPVQKVAERARELLQTPQESYTARTLAQLGFSSRHQGSQQLLVALPLLAEQRDQRLTKELYRRILCHGGASIEGVEKNIRDAIRAAWTRGDREAWHRYFPGATRCPTNKEFLFRMAELLAARKKCG